MKYLECLNNLFPKGTAFLPPVRLLKTLVLWLLHQEECENRKLSLNERSKYIQLSTRKE